MAEKRNFLSVNEDLKRAVAHHQAGRLNEAEEIYRQVLEAESENFDALHLLGVVMAQSGRLAQAIELLNQAVKKRPDNVEAHSNLGNAYQETGSMEKAVDSYRSALAIDSGLSAIQLNLGRSLARWGKLSEAESHFRRVSSCNPTDATAHNELAQILMEQNRIEEAEVFFQRAVELEPDSPIYRCNHAMAHKFSADDPLINVLKGMLGLSKLTKHENNRLCFALGKAFDDAGQFELAFSYFKRANQERAAQATYNSLKVRAFVHRIRDMFKEVPAPGGEENLVGMATPIFVVGPPRSGKSLVESTLRRHQGVVAVGEQCPWRDAMNIVLSDQAVTEPYPRCVASLSAQQIKEIGRIYLQKVCGAGPEARLVVTTIPDNFLYLGLIFEALPTSRVIFCRRDPLDNCLFIYFRRFMWGNEYAYDLKNIAEYYILYQDLMGHWQNRYGDRILTVVYEDLVTDPAKILVDIFAHCGLPVSGAAADEKFTTDEIGHWHNYAPYLEVLRKALA